MTEIASTKEMSDRELDARVAVAAMGWRFIRQDGLMRVDSFLFPPDIVDTYRKGYVVANPSADDFQHDGKIARVPRFSTDIACAMQVIEKMWEKGWQVEIANCFKMDTLIVDNVRAWWVRFVNNKDDLNSWSAENDALPRAICLAALEAHKND